MSKVEGGKKENGNKKGFFFSSLIHRYYSSGRTNETSVRRT